MRIMANGGHANSILEGVPALVLLLTVVLLAAPLGSVVLLFGTTVGAIAHVVVLKLALRDGPLLHGMHFKIASPAWRVVAFGGTAMAIGQFVNSLATPLDQYFAVRSGEGAVSILGYASRVAALFIGIGATALSRATLPVLSELSPDRLASQLWRLAWRWGFGVLLAGVIASAIVTIAAEWIIALLFERGAFTDRDTSAVASILRVLALQFPFFFGGMVFVSYLAVRHAYLDILLAACIALATKMIVLLMVGTQLGAVGVAASTVAMYASSFFILMCCGIRRSRAV